MLIAFIESTELLGLLAWETPYVYSKGIYVFACLIDVDVVSVRFGDGGPTVPGAGSVGWFELSVDVFVVNKPSP